MTDAAAEGEGYGTDHTSEHFRAVWYSNMLDRSIYASRPENGNLRFEERLGQQTLE